MQNITHLARAQQQSNWQNSHGPHAPTADTSLVLTQRNWVSYVPGEWRRGRKSLICAPNPGRGTSDQCRSLAAGSARTQQCQRHMSAMLMRVQLTDMA
jgi:hypothetical protein